jgi:hypothetical protein
LYFGISGNVYVIFLLNKLSVFSTVLREQLKTDGLFGVQVSRVGSVEAHVQGEGCGRLEGVEGVLHVILQSAGRKFSGQPLLFSPMSISGRGPSCEGTPTLGT